MAAKEKTVDPVDAVLEWAHTYKLNVDILREPTPTGEYATLVRLRPWQQSANRKLMYAGWGVSSEIALRMAVKAWVDEREMVLDYAYRPWRDAVGRPAGDRTEVQLPF